MTEDDPNSASPRETIPPVIDHEPAPMPPRGSVPPRAVRDGQSSAQAPAPPPAQPAPRSGGGGSVLLTLVLFLALAGGLYYVWNNPKGQDQDALDSLQHEVQAGSETAGQASAQVQGLAQQVQGLAQQVQGLADRVGRLEKSAGASAPAAPDLGDLPKRVDELTAKIAALENQPAPQAPAAPAQDNGAGQQALAALSQKLDQVQSADTETIGQLQTQQKAALDQVAQQKQALDQAQSALAQNQAALAQEQTALAQMGDRLAKVEKGAGSVEDAATRATRLERIQAAVVALQAGQKLGDIPDAPPALARFAAHAPPTEAALRDSFPALAAHAREVSQPDTAHKSFFQRAFARLQESVTVRQGDDVLVGDPAAGVLSDAEVKVQNGDLDGAVHRLQALHGPAAAAMQGWVDQADSLIAARAALASLAARG